MNPHTNGAALANRAAGFYVMPSARRFPPPWTAEETEPCFIVKDRNSSIARTSPADERPASCSRAMKRGG